MPFLRAAWQSSSAARKPIIQNLSKESEGCLQKLPSTTTAHCALKATSKFTMPAAINLAWPDELSLVYAGAVKAPINLFATARMLAAVSNPKWKPKICQRLRPNQRLELLKMTKAEHSQTYKTIQVKNS